MVMFYFLTHPLPSYKVAKAPWPLRSLTKKKYSTSNHGSQKLETWVNPGLSNHEGIQQNTTICGKYIQGEAPPRYKLVYKLINDS